MFLRAMPEVGLAGLWPIMSEISPPLEAIRLPGEAVIHDPCAARLDEAGQTAVRAVLASLGQSLKEPRYTRRLTLCCGYGGLVDQSYPELGAKFASMRAQEGTEPLLAWCVMCRDRFRGLGRQSFHPLDLLFPDSSDLSQAPKPPGLSARRQNRSLFKRQALTELWGEEFREAAPMSLEIDIPGSVLEDIEARRILVSDVAMVLEDAEKNGPHFHNPDTGRSLACLRPRQVTFWVEYEKRENGSYLVHRAWCHRMTLPNVPGEGAESPASSEGFARTGGRV
jgi:hypothetical protein